MKFSIYKASEEKRQLFLYGTIEASSLEVAGDILFKLLRRTHGQRNGDVFLILPDTVPSPNKSPIENGTPFHILQYREID